MIFLSFLTSFFLSIFYLNILHIEASARTSLAEVQNLHFLSGQGYRLLLTRECKI